MIDGDHGLSIAKQAKALGISRGSVYYVALTQHSCHQSPLRSA